MLIEVNLIRRSDRPLSRILYDEGHTMQHYGLLEFYLAEYLGTKNCHSEEERAFLVLGCNNRNLGNRAW
jgi:hypothetical protein